MIYRNFGDFTSAFFVLITLNKTETFAFVSISKNKKACRISTGFFIK